MVQRIATSGRRILRTGNRLCKNCCGTLVPEDFRFPPSSCGGSICTGIGLPVYLCLMIVAPGVPCLNGRTVILEGTATYDAFGNVSSITWSSGPVWMGLDHDLQNGFAGPCVPMASSNTDDVYGVTTFSITCPTLGEPLTLEILQQANDGCHFYSLASPLTPPTMFAQTRPDGVSGGAASPVYGPFSCDPFYATYGADPSNLCYFGGGPNMVFPCTTPGGPITFEVRDLFSDDFTCDEVVGTGPCPGGTFAVLRAVWQQFVGGSWVPVGTAGGTFSMYYVKATDSWDGSLFVGTSPNGWARFNLRDVGGAFVLTFSDQASCFNVVPCVLASCQSQTQPFYLTAGPWTTGALCPTFPGMATYRVIITSP